MLIFRYFSRELLNSLLTVTLIVLVIFLGNQLIRYLNDAAAGNMALGVMGRLLILEIPYLLGLLLPLTLFIALLLTLGRISADHEWVVLKACGFSPWQQWKMSVKPCGAIVLLVAILTLWIQPKLAGYRNQLLATTNAGATIETLIPGKFQSSGNHNFVFYVSESSVDHKHLKNIFVAEKRATPTKDDTQWNVIKASSGELVEDPMTHAQFIQINQGKRFIGETGLNNYQVIQFDRYLMLARNPPAGAMGNEMDALSLSQLWGIASIKSGDATFRHYAIAELEWRIALPISCFLLSILALCLGEVPPRQGRYARLFPGILLLVFYTNMLFVFRGWIASGKIRAFPGISWMFLALVLFIFFYAAPWSSWRKKYSAKTKGA
ncbi:MAG: lptF [Gammaproteobacteria bacterium]|nr:lptF [Gammaproteobacteria bacterium]